MRRQGYDSRNAWASATSAAMDRADAADRLQHQLQHRGWTVHRHVHTTGVTITITPTIGPAKVYGGPTAHDALRLAVDDVLGAESEGGETE